MRMDGDLEYDSFAILGDKRYGHPPLFADVVFASASGRLHHLVALVYQTTRVPRRADVRFVNDAGRRVDYGRCQSVDFAWRRGYHARWHGRRTRPSDIRNQMLFHITIN